MGITNLPEPASWGSIGAVAGIDTPSAVIGSAIPGGNWLQLGMSLLGGLGGSNKMTQSGAAGGSSGALNTSGWAVGGGSATGGGLDSSSASPSLPLNLATVPWYAWFAGALVAVALIKGGR